MVEKAILKRESPVALLELKFLSWIQVQPEWLLIVAMPRQQRRAAMKELAARLYTIPIMDGSITVPRVIRRKAAKTLGHAVRTGQLSDELKEALAKAAQDAAVSAIDPEGDVKAIFEGSVPATGEVEEPEEFTSDGV